MNPYSTIPIQKTRDIYKGRLDAFLSKETTALNITSRLVPHSISDPSVIHLSVYSPHDQPSFADAIRGNFTPTKVGESFGPSWSTHWFRVVLTLPPKWIALSKQGPLWFHWRTEAETLVWTEDGAPVHGLSGAQRSSFDLSLVMASGRSYEYTIPLVFYMEIAINGLFGNGAPTIISPPNEHRYFKLEECSVETHDESAFKLFYDLKNIQSLISYHGLEHSLSQEALFAANEAINAYNHVDTDAISKCQDMLDRLLRPGEGKRSFKRHRVMAIGNCHIDTAWLWRYRETRRKVARSFASQLALIERHPQFIFAASQMQQFEWLKEDYPLLFVRVQEAIKKGNFIPVGGSWVEMDGNMPSGESFARQFLYGQRFMKEHFGSYNTFGYHAQFPQLIKSAGMKYFVTQKLSWNNINRFPHSTFRWIGLDGSEVLTHFPPANTYTSPATAHDVLASSLGNKDVDRCPVSMLLYGHGDGGGGPTEEMIASLVAMNDLPEIPKIEFTTPLTFFKDLKDCTDKLLSWKGELYLELHRGTFTSQAKTKYYNRHCELLLGQAEMLAILNGLVHGRIHTKYPGKELERLWKIVLLNQFHDVLPGSSIGSVYDDANQLYEEVRFKATKILFTSLADMFDQPFPDFKDSTILNNTCLVQQPAKDIIVFNSTPYERREVLVMPWSESLGSENDPQPGVVAVGDLKGFSMSSLQEKRIPFNPDVNTQRVSISTLPSVEANERKPHYIMENHYVRVHFDSCGHVTGFIDKEVERELIPNGSKANRFVMYEDIPQVWDAWDVELHHLHKGWSVSDDETKIELSIGMAGPLLASLIREITIGQETTIKQVISLSFISKRLDFASEIYWNESHRVLKVEFPLMIHSDMATYECPFGMVQRPTTLNTSWDVARFEVCGHRFADLSEYDYGVAIINDCKYGYSTRGNLIQMTLLRAPKKPDPNCDIGHHVMNFAMFPHIGNVVTGHVVEEATNFNMPLLWNSVSSDAYDKSFLDASVLQFCWPKNVRDDIHRPSVPLAIVAIKKAEDDTEDIIIRAYEPHGGRGSALLKSHQLLRLSHVIPCDLLEDALPAQCRVFLNEDADWMVDFTPFQIITLRMKVELLSRPG